MRIYTIAALVCLCVFLASCTTAPSGNVNFQSPMAFSETDELKKFSSTQDLQEYLMQAQFSGARGMDGMFRSTGMTEMAVMDSATPMAAPSRAGSESGSSDFSGTNVQIDGVDEADFIKTDGEYIYMLTARHFIIIDARDAKSPQKIHEQKLIEGEYWNEHAQNLFINDNRMILFVQKQKPTYFFQRYDIQPQQSQKPQLHALVYDISNKRNPRLIETIIVDGSYSQARMIGSTVYLVTQEGTYNFISEPMVRSSNRMIIPEVYYFDNPESNHQFNTLLSFDSRSGEVVDTKTILLGYGTTLMMSEDNIYIAYQRNHPWRWYGNYEQERFYDVILPRLQGTLKRDIDRVIADTDDEDDRWRKISSVLSDYFAGLDPKTADRVYEEQFKDIMFALEEYDVKRALENAKTMIHKIGVDNGVFTYEEQGEVLGRLLNQFSMDEHDGNLRVATTITIWNRGMIQHNNVYVLDENMQTVGSIEGIARDERIYATRFMADKLYMVTFREVDPFFVIDLADARNPTVLGELKIPGFSSYLHPYGDDFIIGVGRDGDDSGMLGGVKLSLFDVSDFANPREVDSVVIGVSGSDSPVLHDHKAFLFSESKNLLVLPVTERIDRDLYMSRLTWHGAYAFSVSPDGFEQIGKVRHDETTDYWGWWHTASVLRSLYIDDALYTVSARSVKVNDLADGFADLGEVALPQESQPQYWR
jgi:inhibitor of cysteine peptidase